MAVSPSSMLARENRYPLRKRPTFFTEAKLKHSPYFTIWYQKRPGSFQAAVIVGKKVARLAVVRNKLKRWFYQFLEPIAAQKKDLVIVLTLKPKVVKISKEELGPHLVEALKVFS